MQRGVFSVGGSVNWHDVSGVGVCVYGGGGTSGDVYREPANVSTS